jgi:hypothetical protein
MASLYLYYKKENTMERIMNRIKCMEKRSLWMGKTNKKDKYKYGVVFFNEETGVETVVYFTKEHLMKLHGEVNYLVDRIK